MYGILYSQNVLRAPLTEDVGRDNRDIDLSVLDTLSESLEEKETSGCCQAEVTEREGAQAG